LISPQTLFNNRLNYLVLLLIPSVPENYFFWCKFFLTRYFKLVYRETPVKKSNSLRGGDGKPRVFESAGESRLAWNMEIWLFYWLESSDYYDAPNRPLLGQKGGSAKPGKRVFEH
jgi:hypothetical protein